MIKRFTYFFSLLLMLCMGTSANAQGAWDYQWAHSVDGNYFVMANRGGKANNFANTATFYNGTTTFSNLRCWGTVFYSYYFNK